MTKITLTCTGRTWSHAPGPCDPFHVSNKAEQLTCTKLNRSCCRLRSVFACICRLCSSSTAHTVAPPRTDGSMVRTFAACLLLAALVQSAAAASTFEVISNTTYADLAPVAGQWDIAIKATKTADKNVFEPQVCKEDKSSAACNQPLLTADAKDKIQVTATLKAGVKQLKTINDLPPKSVLLRACYSKPSTADRPWRKSNDVIDKDKSCPFIMKSTEFPADTTTVSAEWPIPKNMTKAAWYAAVFVKCQKGDEVVWCQTDNSKNATYFGTTIINSTPTTMVVATAICSAVGPLFLASYFLKDFLVKGKK